jgi:pilus assembly protein Flp/PilA
MSHQHQQEEIGQGLVEYALLLTLVAVAVIAILTFIGPQVAAAFTNVGEVLDGGPITQVTTERRGNKNDKVRIYVTVTEKTRVTFELNGQTKTKKNCNETCFVTFTNVAQGTGQVSITTIDDDALVIYPPG